MVLQDTPRKEYSNIIRGKAKYWLADSECRVQLVLKREHNYWFTDYETRIYILLKANPTNKYGIIKRRVEFTRRETGSRTSEHRCSVWNPAEEYGRCRIWCYWSSEWLNSLVCVPNFWGSLSEVITSHAGTEVALSLTWNAWNHVINALHAVRNTAANPRGWCIANLYSAIYIYSTNKSEAKVTKYFTWKLILLIFKIVTYKFEIHCII
jgi:hypothetical protein